MDIEKTKEETRKHIENVRRLMQKLQHIIIDRMENHDRSKLEEPEVSIFAKYTHKLSESTYGSEEYNQFLKDMKPAIDHHYRVNSHHPENHSEFVDGINGMNIVDLLEMICDWKAATLRHESGDIKRSIEINKKRFNLSDQLVHILMNTVELLDD